MIQFILTLFGFVFPNSTTHTVVPDNSLMIIQYSASESSGSIEDTGGETGQTPPPPKK